MRSRVALVAFVAGLVCWPPARADDALDGKIAEAALREARGVLSRELLGHYDVVDLALLRVQAAAGRISPDRAYGLVTAVITFSTRRNATRHPGLNPTMFEAGSAMCRGWLYLHCGVPARYVFEGRLELLLALDAEGSWRAVPPRWRSRSEYPLQGYLLLEGRAKEGYVLFPR
jgi:hypothetical protein